MYYYLKALKKFGVFDGRASRKEYWVFILFNLIFSIAAIALDNLLGTVLTVRDVPFNYGYIYLLYALAVSIPALAVSTRRLHDVGKSGAYLLVSLIPIIGSIWILLLLCLKGEMGPNRFGPNPNEFTEFPLPYTGAYDSNYRQLQKP